MYQALYRKWRPKSFDDVVSQPHITTTLKNQIINGKTAHSYLFTGSRGTGKTTCARIFAKAVNCENRTDGNPCLKCSICEDADSSALSDIIEIDAASNNGVQDIRDLREGAVYTPERCKFKVYIIDEVHMLSPGAFNALLKIMEEPPPYVKFVLATTEVHKVPATILSRCQRFDFRRIRPEDIADRLKYIADNEDFTLTDDAAALIAKIADGGMRDALSLLDQCVAYSSDVDINTVADAAGIASRDYLFELMDAVIDGDMSKSVGIIDRLYGMSKDMAKLTDELLLQFRNLMLLKTAAVGTDILACLPGEEKLLSAAAAKLSLREILAKLDVIRQCAERLPRCVSKRTELEMCIIRICGICDVAVRTEKAVDKSAECGKIERSEDKPRTTEKKPEQDVQVDFSKLRPEDFKPCGLWAEIKEEMSKNIPAVSGALDKSKAFVNGNVMLIVAENEFFLQLFKNKSNAEQLSAAVETVLGKKYVIRAKCSAKKSEEPSAKIDSIIAKAAENGVEVEEN